MFPRPDENNNSGSFVFCQTKELLAQGIDVRVVSPRARLTGKSNILNDLTKSFEPVKTAMLDNIPVTYIPYWNIPLRFSVKMDISLRHYALFKHVKRMHSLYDFDIIHAHYLFPTGYVAMLISYQIGVPCVVLAHGSDVHTNPHRNNSIAHYTKSTIMKSDRILSVSQELSRQIHNLAKPKTQIQVIYNGVDTDKFKVIPDQRKLRRQLGLPEEGIGICSVCRMAKTKGVVELFMAFKEIAARYSHVWLLMVGEGPLLDKLKYWASEQGLKDRIIFTGSRPHDDIANWLNASDIFALPSYNEGLPVSLFEAMACALPVVVTNVGGIPEAAVDKSTAFLVPPKRVTSLVDAFNKLIQYPELRIQMGKAGLERVRQNFQWSQSAKSLVDVYQRLIDSRNV